MLRTVPTYLQAHVNMIYLVDDCSTDNTQDVGILLSLKYPNIRYIRLPTKGRQMGAKNAGLTLSTANYVYFGDDDSILLPNSISNLLAMAFDYPHSIVGARHIYMKEDDVLESILSAESQVPQDLDLIYDRRGMRLNLFYQVPLQLKLPFCQSCFLVDRTIAQSQRYDVHYIGTCFREETDYIVALRKIGMNLFICNTALQINLPRSMSLTGGTGSVSAFYRHISELFNEYHFFRKNGAYIREFVDFSVSPTIRTIVLFGSKVRSLILNNLFGFWFDRT